MEKYWHIGCFEDGIFITEYKSKEDLLADMKEYEEDHEEPWPLSKKLPDDMDTCNWGFIVKGEIVLPKAKKVVEQYDID